MSSFLVVLPNMSTFFGNRAKHETVLKLFADAGRKYICLCDDKDYLHYTNELDCDLVKKCALDINETIAAVEKQYGVDVYGIVYVGLSKDEALREINFESDINVYIDDANNGYGGIRLIKGKITKNDYRFYGANIFNRLSFDKWSDYIFYPYHSLVRYGCFLDINAFGFRISVDINSLIGRPKNHKVIAIFGGSGSFDALCVKRDSLAYKLQLLVDEYGKNKDVCFTVLNFSMPSSVITDQIMIYLTLCWNLNPDIVISHDGFNDFVGGQLIDKRLVLDYKILYPFYQEKFSYALYEHNNDCPKWEKYHPVVAPEVSASSVLEAYMSRKRQFAEIVQGRDNKFISALQPISASKKELSQSEQDDKCFFSDEHFNVNFERALFLYDQAGHILSTEKFDCINFHTLFGEFDHSVTLFGDPVHQLPKANDFMARKYFEFIMEAI